MAVTPSEMLPLGTPLPSFALPDTRTGQRVSSSDFAERPVVVAFICNHCPFVIHVREGLAELGRYARERDVGMVGISSNDVTTHPQDGPEQMKAEAERAGYEFPYLYDETQDVAKAYRAACTPDFFLFDADQTLVYRGQLDDSRPSNGKPVTRAPSRRPARPSSTCSMPRACWSIGAKWTTAAPPTAFP